MALQRKSGIFFGVFSSSPSIQWVDIIGRWDQLKKGNFFVEDTKRCCFWRSREEVDPEMKTGKASTYSHQDAFITNSLKSRTTIIFSPASWLSELVAKSTRSSLGQDKLGASLMKVVPKLNESGLLVKKGLNFICLIAQKKWNQTKCSMKILIGKFQCNTLLLADILYASL